MTNKTTFNISCSDITLQWEHSDENFSHWALPKCQQDGYFSGCWHYKLSKPPLISINSFSMVKVWTYGERTL